jgi:hypothetical protein
MTPIVTRREAAYLTTATRIKLVRQGDGTFTDEQDAVWTPTDYSEPACEPDCLDAECDRTHADHCAACDEPVYGAHYFCLDGADSAHVECIEIESPIRFLVHTVSGARLGYSIGSERAARHFVFLYRDRIESIEAIYSGDRRVALAAADFAREAEGQ